MILKEETYAKWGYYPSELTQKSNKKILVSCDNCGKIRTVKKEDYRDLCMSCARRKLYTDPKERGKQSKAHSGNKNHMFGKQHSEETKQKIRIKARLFRPTEETRRKLGKALKNRVLSEEHKRKIGEAHKGRIISIEQRRAIGEANRKRIFSEETKRKISESQTGEKSPQWKGGISFGKYCPKFNKDLKERVREYFDRKCYLCGKSEKEEGKHLAVHHVLYDKSVCCNNSLQLFVPLCNSCHTKTNHNRKYWQTLFRTSLAYLTDNKCYYTQEERRALKSGHITNT